MAQAPPPAQASEARRGLEQKLIPECLAMVKIQDVPGGCAFAIKVHPRARKSAIAGEIGDALKVHVTALPVEGRANEACIQFLAELLEVPRSSVTIAAGRNSRNKVICVMGHTAEQVRARLSK